MCLQRVISKKKLRKNLILMASWKLLTKRVRSVIQCTDPKDLDPSKNVTDPAHRENSYKIAWSRSGKKCWDCIFKTTQKININKYPGQLRILLKRMSEKTLFFYLAQHVWNNIWFILIFSHPSHVGRCLIPRNLYSKWRLSRATPGTRRSKFSHMRLADKRLGFELKLKKVLTFNYCFWI